MKSMTTVYTCTCCGLEFAIELEPNYQSERPNSKAERLWRTMQNGEAKISCPSCLGDCELKL